MPSTAKVMKLIIIRFDSGFTELDIVVSITRSPGLRAIKRRGRKARSARKILRIRKLNRASEFVERTSRETRISTRARTLTKTSILLKLFCRYSFGPYQRTLVQWRRGGGALKFGF